MTQDLISNRLAGYTPLSRSYKGVFPFRIATTSYIYPDYILPNVRMLAPYLDEIELILFEANPEDGLPARDDIMALSQIGLGQEVSYNVHLPIDIFLGDPDPRVRGYGVDIVREIIGLTSPLNPSSYTLHLESKGHDGHHYIDIDRWRARLSKSIEEILQTGIAPRQISIETLDYPLGEIDGIIEGLDLSVCLDLGHLILYGRSIEDYAARYLNRATVIHLHGVRDGLAHLSLNALDGGQVDAILAIFGNFSGTVSLEVFSICDLMSSLECLERHWMTCRRNRNCSHSLRPVVAF